MGIVFHCLISVHYNLQWNAKQTKKTDIVSAITRSCKINTIPILMHQMRFSTNHASSAMLNPTDWKSEMLDVKS
jgi:hypothetical protein